MFFPPQLRVRQGPHPQALPAAQAGGHGGRQESPVRDDRVPQAAVLWLPGAQASLLLGAQAGRHAQPQGKTRHSGSCRHSLSCLYLYIPLLYFLDCTLIICVVFFIYTSTVVVFYFWLVGAMYDITCHRKRLLVFFHSSQRSWRFPLERCLRRRSAIMPCSIRHSTRGKRDC